MEIKVGKRDIIWSYLGSFFQYCTSLIILPLILSNILEEELGLWYSFASIGTLVTYLDFGFSTTLVRNITYAWSGANKIRKQGFDTTDVKKDVNVTFVKQILFTCRMVCLVVALIALMVMATAGTVYVAYISRGLMNKGGAMLAWGIYAVAMFLNIYYNYCANALRGIGLISQYQKILVVSRIAQIALSYLGIKIGYGLIALSAAYLVSGFMIRVFSKYYLDRAVKEVEEQCPKLANEKTPLRDKILGSVEIFKDIWFNAKRSGIISLCSYATNQSLTLICSAYLGVGETAAYGLSLQIVTAIMNVAGILMAAYQPKLINSMVLGKNDEYRKMFSMCMFVFSSVALGGITAFSLVSKELLTLLGSNTSLPIGMFCFMGLYMYLEQNHGQYTSYFTMRNEIIYLKAYVISSLCIVLGSWILAVCGMNIYVLMLVHFVVQICFNNWYWPHRAMKLMNTNVIKTAQEGAVETWGLLKKLLRI